MLGKNTVQIIGFIVNKSLYMAVQHGEEKNKPLCGFRLVENDDALKHTIDIILRSAQTPADLSSSPSADA